ncbi:MAG: glycosyltransferase family 4 protein [Candidatus Moranbacteria bacterium]|nr:glycosyltransferase family 4 protein [Candidatus Moranbacteria bacterium]
MKIAMIIEAWEPIWGGGQVHVLELSKKLVGNHGCKIDVYTMNLRDEKDQIQNHVEKFKNGDLRIIRTGKIKNFHSLKDRIFWIFEVIQEIKKNHNAENYDIIHAHANLPGIPGKILNKILKIPIVYTVHGSNFLDVGEKNPYYYIEKFLMTQLRYDLEISVTKKFLGYKNVNYPLIIPNGVAIEKFENTSKKLSSEKNPGIFRILFVGRLDKIKGVDILLQAVGQLSDSIKKKIQLHLVGYGYDEKNLKVLAKKLNLDNIVFFKGKKIDQDLLEEYAMADLFILPSLSEGFPLTILEAWAMKVPVLATKVGEIPHLIREGENGFLSESGDVPKITDKLSQAISSDNLKAMGIAGYNLVMEKYTWKDVAEKTYEAYSKIHTK